MSGRGEGRKPGAAGVFLPLGIRSVSSFSATTSPEGVGGRILKAVTGSGPGYRKISRMLVHNTHCEVGVSNP
jgi:hypothetical protein